MRNRKLSPAQSQFAAMLGPLDGAEIPGGCDTCDATQTVAPLAPGVWEIRVGHDDRCPTLRRLEANAGRR